MMEFRNVNTARESHKHANREDYIHRNVSVYMNDDTDPEDAELSAEDYDDAPLEAEEESEDYDDDGDRSEAAGIGEIQPVWLLHEGQILWAASRYGFRLSPKEYFRRRLQTLLDFMAAKFPGKSYGELLVSLQGFFAKDNDSSKGSWLESLKNAGIVYMSEESGKYEIMPLGNFRAGKGHGKPNELPEKLKDFWLQCELSRTGQDSANPHDWGAILENFKKFCEEINDLCSRFDAQEEAPEDGKTSGIGLKKIEINYQTSTLERNILNKWKKRSAPK